MDLSEGKTLYASLNCNTCHAHGGGDIGPALADDTWLYGAEQLQVYASITQGRPNRMPSFSGKITEDQPWKLAAYVRSMSGQAGKNAAPGRDDHLGVGDPENSRKKKTPKQTETNTARSTPSEAAHCRVCAGRQRPIGGPQDVLSPAGVESGVVSGVWWQYF